MKRKFTFLITAALMLLTMMAQPGRAVGQTTHTIGWGTASGDEGTYTNFTATSGSVANVLSFTTAQNSAQNPPAYNGGSNKELRLYYASNGNGCSITLTPASGLTITQVVITASSNSYTPIVKYSVDEGDLTAASWGGNLNTVCTISGISASSSLKVQNANTSSKQLRIKTIAVTYTSGSSSLTSTTVTIDATELTNTDVYVSTEAGSLSASVTETESGDDVDGATVTWSSSNTGVAIINEAGVVTLVAVGTTTITANYAGESGVYSSSSSTYELTVTSSEPYVQPTTIEITPNYTFWGKTGQFSGNTYSELSGSKDNVSLYWTKGSGSTYANSSSMRFYKDNTLVFTAPTGYEIKSIVITFTTAKDDLSFSPEGYSLSGTTGTWAGSSATVTMSRPSNADSYAQISKFTVTIGSTSNLLTVTYDANGAASGSVPTDSNEYESGAEVTVLGNTGNLAKSGYVWAGWNTKADGTGTDHAEGSKFNISENTTLYAKWDAKTITNLTYSGTPTATQYAGQAFNPAGLTVTATFNDESEEDVTSQVVWTPNPLTIETTSVAGTYMGLSVVVEDITVTYAPGTQDNPYTVAQARAATPATGTSANVYIHGIVSAFYNTSIVGDGSNYRYYISDDGTTTSQLLVYKGKGLNNETFSNANDLLIGDIVTIYGGLTMYQSEPEIASGNCLTSLERPAVDVEAPTYSIPEGGYAEAQTVTITCATDGATIYYTLDGSTPDNTSTTYSTPIAVYATTTIKAIAYVGESSSIVSSATYYIKSTGNTYTVTAALGFDEYPVNNIFVQGIVSTAPTSLLDGGLLTYYVSVDGEATNQLQVYKGKNLGNTAFTEVNDIQVGDIVTIFGNVKIYNNQKEFDQGNYLVTWERLETVATPTFTPEEGEYAEAQSVTIACATEGATIYYKTAENAEWAVYSEAINVTETTTIWAYAAKDGMNNSDVTTATYTINIPVPSITVTPGEVDIVDAGGGGTLTATYTNMGDVDDILADIVFYESDGTTPTTYNWITVDINNNDNTVVEYLAAENEGAARTAYFKVYGTTDGDNFTYSNLVTISQAAHVTPPTTDNYELYNGALVEGDYLIVYDGVAMNNVTSSDRLQYEDVEITEDVISTSNATIVWHIAPSGDYWTIYSADANAYAASTGAKNKAQMLADGTDDKALWTVSGTSTYEFVNKQNTANNVNANLRRNGTYGFACYATSTGDALSLYKKASTEPAITLDSYSIEANAEGLEGNLTVTYTNYENPDDIETVVWFCDENGENAVEYDWIVAEIDDKDVTNLYYIIDANNGAARTAYFKVHEISEDVYSELVTITQEAYVATITVVPAEVTDVPAAGDVPEHTVTLVNLTISSADDFEFVYCDSEGNILGNEDPKPNWIELADAEYDLDSENVYTMMYIIAENTETTPRTGYFKIGVEQTTGTVYSNLVTVTQDGAVVYYSVAFNCDGGTFVGNDDFPDIENDKPAGTYTLPSATKSGFTFVGWNDGATTYASGAEYTVSGDVTFTTQWTEVVGVTYELVVSTDDIVPDCYYLITSGTNSTVKAMAGQNTNNRAAVDVTASDGVISNIGEAIAFIISGNGTDLNPYTIYDENVPGYLYAAGTSSANYLKTQAEINARAQWTITINNSSQAIITALTDETDRKIMRYNSVSDVFSCYGSGQQPIYLFKKVDNSPSISADNVNIAYNATSGSIIYEINNYVEGTMTATTEADWISDFTYEQVYEIGEVGFTTTANESYESRSATVTLTYTYEDSKATVTKDVTVTQAAAPAPTHTVYFSVNGTIDDNLTVAGSSITLPTASTLTPEGFEIYGWALGNSTEAVADPYEPTADVTLYALLQLENAPAPSENYVKVTEELTDWSGEYLIVYEDGGVAFDGSLETLDGASNTIEVTITNNTIVATATTDDSNFTIAALSEGGYSIQSASGYYIGKTNDGNGLDSSTETVYVNTISYDTENECVNIISSGGAYLRYNSNSGQERFRYFKSSTYTGQQAIQLYKKTSEATTPTIVNVAYVSGTTSMPENIPESTCYVVENGAVLTFTGTNEGTAANLVVQEGGQLIHTADVEATVQKGVSGYINKSGDGWYLISSPVDNLPTSAVATGTYDLFAYDEATAYWWVDHAIQGQLADHTFTTLERGKGYLYANAANVNLNYAGTMKATNANIKVDLSYACDDYPDLKGFNLVGNPFTRNLAYGDMTIIGGEVATSYLILNNDEDYEECNLLNGDKIKPGQGFFIQATAANQRLEFNPSSKDMSVIGLVSIKAGDENYTDKAYIQFGGGNTLRKMTFGEKSQVYVMNDDLDYATARVEELAGTMPVHFVPIADGFYTITVETKNIENLNYMHLIDNITNTDIDLLAEPSYTFKASESDNANRFHLVFDFNNYTGVNENYTNDNFAHQIGDEIFVSGEGTLQVFDVLGRFVTGYNVNGDKRISTAEFNTGVYIFRMVGTEVKTQKIIVR